MDEFASDTDSDYTSYWRDWVSHQHEFLLRLLVMDGYASGSMLGFHRMPSTLENSRAI